jgi:hypothetical protein
VYEFFILTILVDYQVNNSQMISSHKWNNSWLSPIVLANCLLNLFKKEMRCVMCIQDIFQFNIIVCSSLLKSVGMHCI